MACTVWIFLALLTGGAFAATNMSRAGTSAQPKHPGNSNLVVRATVVRVIDGDSMHVNLDSGPMEVRFHGADAPESKQPFGRQAKAELARMLGAGQTVELLPVDQDRYERMVAVVYAGGTTVNEAMIADGYAWAYRNYLGQIKGDEHYCELESQARSAHLGLWSQPTELWVPPWIYRQRALAGPGAKVPSRDYSRETAADCVAAMKESRLKPLPQGAPDPKCVIKGNINGKGVKIYHLPGDPTYEKTRIDSAGGERWFCTEEEAKAAGWRAPR